MTNTIKGVVSHIEHAIKEIQAEADKKIAQERNAAINDSRNALAAALRDLFARNPDLESFGWRQNVEWNDQCMEWYANLYDGSLTINGYDADARYAMSNKESEPYERLARRVSDFLRNLTNERDFHTLFGDGAEITVRRGPNGNALVEITTFETALETCGESYY